MLGTVTIDRSRRLTSANHAAEVKLRAERKAGELLTTLAEQSKEEQRRGNRYTLESYQADNSLETPYRAALADTATPIATAQRWQTVAQVPDVDPTKGHLCRAIVVA